MLLDFLKRVLKFSFWESKIITESFPFDQHIFFLFKIKFNAEFLKEAHQSYKIFIRIGKFFKLKLNITFELRAVYLGASYSRIT